MAAAGERHPATSFHYAYSCDLKPYYSIKIGSLEGTLPRPSFEEMAHNPILRYSGRNISHRTQQVSSRSMQRVQCVPPPLMVEAVIMLNNEELHLPVTTSFKYFNTRCAWNQWITLPIQICDLPREAIICITIYDCNGPEDKYPIGGSAISVFGKKGLLRQGQMDLVVWPGVEADGEADSKTPGKDRGKEEVHRLVKLGKKYRNGKIHSVDWLDRITFAQVEKITQKDKLDSAKMYLNVEFPKFKDMDLPISVVYYESQADNVVTPPPTNTVVCLPDPDIGLDNLVEAKHYRLTRSHRTGLAERELKPNPEIRNKLNAILVYPTTQILTSEEQDLVWRYRYYLAANKKALAKFVKCVNWKAEVETNQAMELINKWAPMDVEDALELLGPNFKHPALRKYAVRRLSKAEPEDLQLYLLQLVQALKYENFSVIMEEGKKLDKEKEEASRRSSTGTAPVVEGMNKLMVNPALATANLTDNQTSTLEQSIKPSPPGDTSEDEEDLASFLIQQCCRNSSLASYFYWYLLIECEELEGEAKKDVQVQDMYKTVLKRFSEKLRRGSDEWRERQEFLERQHTFITKLVAVMKIVTRENVNRKRKIEKLQSLLASGQESFKFNFTEFEPIPFPLDPDEMICGMELEKATLFKSSLMPARLTFLTDKGETYMAIFKYGDDLRQDQLILQIITLMDQLLRRENLDLKLTPYRVLATSSRHGMMEYIDATAIAELLSADGSILNFFRKHNPQESGPYGVTAECMDTYVKSCAGYCVITYLLGVGDRHLDNLMLSRDGKLVHIDFGYILGRDPKPLPPPMKLSKEMIEGFGGMQSEHYQQFRRECYTAFLYLRRHANLILNLFGLMVDASVPDIALEPDKTVKKVQDKFRLDLSEEEAVQYMQTLIDISATAIMAVMVERLHQLAQYWRK